MWYSKTFPLRTKFCSTWLVVKFLGSWFELITGLVPLAAAKNAALISSLLAGLSKSFMELIRKTGWDPEMVESMNATSESGT